MRGKTIYILSLLMVFLISCEKDINVDIPLHQSMPVVEGFIEQGQPPIIILTQSMGYFEPTDMNAIQNIFLNGADITLSDGIAEEKLIEICTSSLPDSILPLISELTGIPAENLRLLNYCLYTTFNTNLWGKIGRTYSLKIEHGEKTYTSVTTILPLIPLDSLWFVKNIPQNPWGLIWARLYDPPGKGNAYRIYSKRLGRDDTYIPAWGSVFDDSFIDDKMVDFHFHRGFRPGSTAPDDQGPELGYYKEGDTVVVKFSVINQSTYRFLRDFETETASAGNPFAAPSTIATNINGGALGYFGGYGAVYDTLVLKSN
jgi:hypothetical protein